MDSEMGIISIDQGGEWGKRWDPYSRGREPCGCSSWFRKVDIIDQYDQ